MLSSSPEQQQTTNNNKKRQRGKRGEGWLSDELGKQQDLSHTTINKVQVIEQKATDDQKKKLEENKITIHEVYKEIKKEEKRDQMISEQPVIKLPENAELHNADFVKHCDDHIPTNSIDLIYTDPPYGEEAVHYYSDLAKVAIRVLKNGGSLVTFAGQYTLPEVLRALASTGLRYFWTLAVIHSGPSQAIHPRKILCNWKPLL